MKILLTGVAGFIGFHLAKSLLEDGHEILGIDNINSYYDQRLKLDRLEVLGISLTLDFSEGVVYSKKYTSFTFRRLSIENMSALELVFNKFRPELVINLAAQAGVRYSITNPEPYIQSNVVGFFNILELCRRNGIKKVVFASSSSVYGNSISVPCSESEITDMPVSLYAATKKSNEVFAHSYAHLYNMEIVGLRFFTVYGPYGRPDMAYFNFAKSMLAGDEIEVYNHGYLSRDFTFIKDVVESLSIIVNRMDKQHIDVGLKILNIGNSSPVKLLDFILEIEAKLNVRAKLKFVDMQPGDVFNTYADVSALQKEIGKTYHTPLSDGISTFVEWYKFYYGIV
jgi:UDP-glucuronate 4-epimerase